MRRTSSVRHQGKPSLTIGGDELGVLKESDETLEDLLRRQLLEKDRENDKLQTQVTQLKAQLADRPPLDVVQDLRKEYTNLEIILQGTQRENERCMSELERAKARERALEGQLEKLAGPNWQENLDLGVPLTTARTGMMSPSHARTASVPQSASIATTPASRPADTEAQKAYMEQMRLLILGMEQRMKDHEEKLLKTIKTAGAEAARYEEARRQALAT